MVDTCNRHSADYYYYAMGNRVDELSDKDTWEYYYFEYYKTLVIRFRLYANASQHKTTGATSGVGTAYPYGAPEFPRYLAGFVLIFSFICKFCRSLFVLLFFFF